MMDRRAFIVTAAGGIVAARLDAAAEPAGKVYRIGWLAFSATPSGPDAIDTFRRALSELVALAAAVRAGADGLFVTPSPLNTSRYQLIADFAMANRLPSISGDTSFVSAGGLMSYWTDWRDVRRRSATYVDKILRGAKPGDLPIEQPTKLELVVAISPRSGHLCAVRFVLAQLMQLMLRDDIPATEIAFAAIRTCPRSGQEAARPGDQLIGAFSSQPPASRAQRLSALATRAPEPAPARS